MANLENNNENENKKSVTGKLQDQLQQTAEQVGGKVQETLRDASELASDAILHPVETAKEFGKQAGKDVTNYKWWAKLLLVLFWSVFSVIVLFFVVINLKVTKRWAAEQALQILNQDFKAEMSTADISVNFFGDILINGLKIKDYKGIDFIKIREFRASSDWFSLASNAISGKSNSLSFDRLSLTNADIKVVTYKGDSISNFIRYIELFDSGKAPDPNKPPFQLNSRVDIIDSKVSIINQNSPGEEGKWLSATKFNLRVPQLKVNGSNIFGQINNLSFLTSRWGKSHFVDTFSGEFAMTNDFLSLKDLTINTDHSLLQGAIRFGLNNGSWADFTDRVKWDLTLKPGSQISGYDISYFETNWDNFTPINFSGKMSGPLNKFYLEDFLIKTPDVNIHTSTMKIDKLLAHDFQIETNSLSTDFTYKGLKNILPSFIASKMKNFADDFGRLKFNGAANVNPKRVFVPNANLITGIGQAKINNLVLSDYSSDMPKYIGFVEVNDLNTSVITKSKEVGLISGKFNLQGQSFDVNTMRIQTRSQISKIQILDKTIHNVVLDGMLDHRTYRGIVNVNDPQAKANIDGFIDFKTNKIAADVKADLQYLNLAYFTGARNQQIVKGSMVGKLQMSSVNDLTMDADFQQIVFTDAANKYSIPRASLKTYLENGSRTIKVDAPSAVQGEISGKFNLADLADMVQNGIGKILVGPEPKKIYRGQSFQLAFNIEQSLMNFFAPELRLSNGAEVSGSFNGNTNDLILNVDVPKLVYQMTNTEKIKDADLVLAKAGYMIREREKVTKDSITAENVVLKINTADRAQQVLFNADRATFGANVFKDLVLTGQNENNSVLHIATNFKHGTADEERNQKLHDYSIKLNQSTNAAGDFVFRFEPTTVTFNDVAWSVDASPELNHAITYRKKNSDFLIENLRLFSDDSELFVKNAIFKSGKDFTAQGEVKNLNVAKVFAFTKSENSMDIQGIANGTFDIRMSKENLEPLVDLTVTDIKMNGKDMGKVLLSAKKSAVPNVFDVEAEVISSGFLGRNNLHLTGTVNNNTASPTLDLSAEMNDFDLGFTQEFVKTVFANMRGKASGDLKIKGSLDDVDYSGDIALKNFGLKLNFTGVDYSFDDNVVSISKGLAIINDIGVRDGRTNSKGSVSGAIQFETLSSMGVNLVMRADNLMLLNNTQKDSDLFWGRVYGTGTLYVDGPVSGLNISTPEMKALNNSVFTFNSNSTSNVEEFKMLRFLKRTEQGEIFVEEKAKTSANINVDFTISVDKGTTVNVLVGKEIGDISVRGNAEKLRFRMSRSGAVSMNGDYFVDNGTFVSKAILNRTFQIARGSSIRWDGEPTAPALDINATYLRTVSNAGQYLNMGSLQPINILLSTKITQTLNNPKIELGVDAQDVSSDLKTTLALKMSNEDEKIIQFGSILVLSSFNVSNSAFDINIGNTLESSGYNMLFKQLGSVLNTISNEFQVDLNYLSGDIASNRGDRASASVSMTVSPRVTVKTGLGIPITKTENANADYLSGEGIIEYDWSTKNDGSRLLRAYSKPSNIGLNGTGAANAGANQSYGVGVVYSKSFNTIFKKKKKDKINKTSQETDTKEFVKKDTLK